MWTDSGEDPGGGASNQELSDLKDQCEQQQVLIAQLKEILRKNEQTNVTQEKVDEYMNTLTRMNARVKKSKRKDLEGGRVATVDIPAKSKIDLLRQQVAENRAKLAERDKSQKGIEEMVTQIQAQLDDSQQWINQTPLNLSLQDTNKIEYSQNSSSEELYNILLIKEKRITELVNKTQKLESNILDLQENLKEKDSVIDARTKAITLMTENLSKKSKGTLDALDETKEQMRKMQENFVSLESEMKARQMKLLDDLRLKNYEIAELQEVNSKLQQELSDKTDTNDLNKRIQELEELNQQLQQKLSKKTSKNNKNNELQEKFDSLQCDYEKLTITIKEKDDCIENLQKSLKDLENQQIKGDSDELIKLKKQLDENNKNMIKIKAQSKSKIKELTKKIDDFKKINDINAELVKFEAENCKLNQKIAELEEEKGSLQLKLMETDRGLPKEIEEEIETKDKLIEAKSATISTLENEITTLKTEIETLTEKLNNSPSFEHVKSEMTSIQFEEQLDELRKENQQNLLIIQEKDEKIELLLKEKQELSMKLENYIQENIELIDKLEKLSAEKVSSAESIEIVENLTQQEKLELEAYQKNVENPNNRNNLKASDENLPQVDLNESVNELNEETSELLQKIQLFTIERREVMEKMEQLKHENNNLILKMNEIENNRDILAETYEHLQNEKDALLRRFDEIQQENEKLKNNEKKIDELLDENQQLLMKLEENERLRNEQQDLEIELNQIKQINEELIRDVDNYKKSIDEMNNLTDSIQQLREQLQLTIEENRNLKIRVEELENNKNDLDKQIEKYHDDLETIEWENRKLLESKDNEIGKLIKERDNLQNMIEDLQKTIQTKDENYNKLHNELKEKYLQLQKQLQENSDNFENMKPFEQKIDELTNKNKEQLDKMKKIAANLKKKTQAYQELQDEYKLNQEKWLNETQEKDLKITTLLQQLQELEETFTEKTQQLENYESRNIELQNTIIELRTKLERTTEINLQQELLQTKENIIDIESNENLLKSKIQELEMLLETKENDLLKSNERITKLEEGIRFVEERRMSLEKRTNELGAQLEEKQQNYDEITKNEDLLEKRLIALVEHDEIIEKKLENSIQENVELNQQILELNRINGDSKKKLEELQKKLERLENYESMVEELENSNQELLRIKQNLENDLKNLQNDHKQITQEFDKVNNDWQQQFDEMFKEKNELLARCERLEDELKQIHDKNSSLNDQLNFYKNKLENNEVEMRHYEEQIEQLLNDSQKHVKLEEEINDLKQQHTEKLQEIELLRNECEQLRNKVDKNVENQAIVEEKIPTIVWSDQGNDPFDFISNQNQTVAEEKIVTVEEIQPQQQDLQQKIKTLEFMLFNAEKERDDALTQCQQLTNELTRFVYDKISIEQLESQILSNDQLVENKENLQKLEYEPIKPPVEHAIDQQGGIDEEKCEQKSAYLCYPKQPINEDIVKSEIATVSTTKRDTFGESEDGWGWSPEDIQLEEQHNNDIDLLKERINVLEIERNQHLEEIKQLQIKSGKLIKKLKELKLKNDELQRTKRPDDFNLDDTIQEEFKLQIQQIERQLNETRNDLEKERLEKQSLQKRCDLLITANERMIEMKEKHEIELLGWQQNCRELNAKLERYEWGQDDGFITNEPTNIDENDNERKINQLNETIKELTLDNDELQKLLEEQRQLRIEAEKAKIIDNTTEKLNESLRTIELIEIENAGKTKIIEKLQETIKELSGDNENLQKLLDEQRQLQIEAKQTTEECDLLKKQIVEKIEIIERLEATIKELSLDNEQLQKLLEEQRQLRIETEQSRIVAQTNECDLLKNQINKLTVKLDESLQKIESLQNENVEKTIIVQQLNDKIVEYQNDLQMKDIEINSIKSDLEKFNKNYDETIQLKQNEILQLTNQIQQHTDEMNLLNTEWQLRVDQRGNDVAESWKLHIDSRETEFKQIEDSLRKEILDFEEKCNALMNENNELRKNVDIEIRNEVDRINNLQQQINERQQIINDLTNTIQMKQLEIERITNELQQKQQLIENILEKFHIVNEPTTMLLNCEKFYKDYENNCRQLEEIENRELLLQQEIQQKNEMITNLTQQLQHIQSLKEYENENVENLQQNLVELQQINATINAQLQDKSKLYENLNRELQERNNELDEIKRQNNVLINEQLQEIDLLKRRLIDNDELLNQKTNDLLNLQQQLNEKSNEIVLLQQKINEQNQLLSDEDKQLMELRNIIEEQVMKIENLKTELYEKSNDYDSLIAEMDMSRMNQHQKIKEEYRQQQQQQQNNNKDDDLSDPVSRAELDLALYMLHQRDVRCEELTVELTQLLEERDTLQLRLSNALREKEEIYKRLKIVDGNEGGSSNDPTTMNITTSTITTTGDDSILAGSSEKSIKDNQLDNKISELKTVGYKRDKTIVDEQELRRLQQLSILQQHKDVAAKLPAEAAARLVDASYTLSRDVQSPSKVLLNWLWGKSTPKVNDI